MNQRLVGGTWFRSEPVPEGGGTTGGAVAEEASALSIEILLSGEEPKFGPKTQFFEATPGGTRDRF